MENIKKSHININIKKPNKGKNSDLVSISKTMTLILRHKAKDFGIEIDPSGFVKLDDLFNNELLKKKRITLDLVKEIVASDQKQRFQLVDRPPYYIRANQGHSIEAVKNEEILQSIKNYSDYQTVVHGSFSDAWEKIKLTGLNKMGRNCIHFAIGYPKDSQVISGMRTSCDVFIEIDLIRAIENKIPFFISDNSVILSPGINGVLPIDYFRIVRKKSGEILYQQNYDFLIWINFTDISENINQILNFSIIDIINNSIVKEFDFTTSILNELDKVNKLIDFLTTYEMFLKKIVIGLMRKDVLKYQNFIHININNLRYKSFFIFYLSFEEKSCNIGKESSLNEKIINICKKEKDNLNFENVLKLNIDIIKSNKDDLNLFNNIEKKINSDALNQNIHGIMIGNKKDNNVKNVKINSTLILNEEISKVFVYLELELDYDAEEVYGIQYALFNNLKYENYLIETAEFDSEKSLKENLEKFNFDFNQNFESIFKDDYLSILLISVEDIEIFKKIHKQNLCKLHRVFDKNIITFKRNNLNIKGLDLDKKIETFVENYLKDKESHQKVFNI